VTLSAAAGAEADGAIEPVPASYARYPFPQNARSSRCIYPTRASFEHVRTAYARWKHELVTADGAGGHLRIRRPDSPGAQKNSTVSEGIAYGMVLSVMMDDQPLFDELWKYSQLWLDDKGLMHWYIDAAGNKPLGTGAALDSDEDIAWALVMADRQWGSSPSLASTYLDLAREQIDRVWRFEVDHSNGMILPGDDWGDNKVFNPSYFAPNEYRLFGKITGNVEGWERVIDTGYAIMERSLNRASGNADNGLLPAWCDFDGSPRVPFPGGPTNYQYDSARCPFRIGQDFADTGDPRARAYLAKVSRFFASVGARNIVDGYELDGTPKPDAATPAGSPQSAVFVGGAAVGAMHDPAYQAFVDEAYDNLATGTLIARSKYYNLSWTVWTLLMLSGNLFEFPE
jgi:endo-1,4-beta-D-glucanase Y